ncbi:glucose-6-phosphate isomerase glycosomal [Perkinsela sp. CCAP 1560/4]|nr:glucose-6-phosphate isomerase glycosomal [Perkinsela sp. CCAP 1560/4]|eukprot:KNH09360.1 glucose-6-phosphate isomerase glycosomal [Perkinsela sp. CCAP 1560/4]
MHSKTHSSAPSKLSQEWLALVDYHKGLRKCQLSSFLTGEQPDVSERVKQLTIRVDLGEENFLHADFSKNYLTQESIGLYTRFAEEKKLGDKIHELMNGGVLNHSEGRNVSHVVLRSHKVLTQLKKTEQPAELSAEELVVFSTLKKIERICDAVVNGKLQSAKNVPFRHVVNIGIGGSDLGPCMACESLEEFSTQPKSDLSFHFISNIDGNALHDTLKEISVSDSLFIIASKSFTTGETMANMNSILGVLHDELMEKGVLPRGGSATLANSPMLRRHFIAVSCRGDNVKKSGFDTESDAYLNFNEGVGGRYSLWGPVGLSIALKCGFSSFVQLLEGAQLVDAHTSNTSLDNCAPFLMACAEITYNNFFGWRNRAVVPYNQRLSSLVAYLQQLEMESNGKRVTASGDRAVDVDTCPVVFGGSGTNSQHAFFQLLHQGTDTVPVDFIIALQKGNDMSDLHQDWLVANCFAQSQALLMGDRRLVVDGNRISADRSTASADLCRQFTGDRPSTTLITQRLTPLSLGALLALYEHKVFIESILWEVNAFDQWGVELGKQIAHSIYREISDSDSPQSPHDASTAEMLNLYKQVKH